jgi:CheY-like chemotaxis protein/predicted regulator of Ras-like GTPase activity (Roadblock/LC7/MglB family)
VQTRVLEGCSLLVVDDEQFFVTSLVEGLCALVPSLDVCIAHDGAAALRELERRRFDAIVTDLEMPGLDGFALLAAMRERASTTPALVVSTHERAAVLHALGPTADHLRKPLDFGQLVAALVALLERTSSPASLRPPTTHEASARRLQPRQEPAMSNNIQQSLQATMELQGAMGAALVDWENGMCLGTAGGIGINLEVAAAGNTEVVRAKMRVMKSLGIKGNIEDMLITLTDQYHLLRPTGSSLFLYLVLDRKNGNLALARLKLAEVGRSISL